MTSKLLKVLLPLLILSSLCSCSLARQALATLQSTSDFHILASDRRIFYEDGAEDICKELAEYLPASIAQVEKKQYGPFPGPVEVYVCATNESFSKFTGLPAIKAITTMKHIFIAAQLLREQPPNIRRAVLTHELSHFHLQQHLGSNKYGSNLPAWFQEGLAEYVSGGASMTRVSEAEAEKAILDGRHISADTTGSFLFPKRWDAYGINPPMFYRQSFMFVSYLRHLDESGFRVFVLALQKGENFEHSFKSTFGLTMEAAWHQFVAQIKSRS